MSVTVTKFGDPKKGAQNGLDKIILIAAINLTNKAKKYSPKDTGRLRSSIMYKTDKGKSGGNGGYDELTVNPDMGSAVVGTGVGYGVYQEFGTRKIAPKPFLRPAAEIIRGGNITEVEKKIMNEQMRGALKKGQKRETFGL